MSNNGHKRNILVPDLIKPPTDVEQAVFGPEAKITTAEAMGAQEVDENLWADCDGIVTYDKIQYTPEVISKLKKCKVLVRAGIGFDNIDVEEARRSNIVVCNVPDYCIEEVADHTMAFILALDRNLYGYADDVREKKWPRNSRLSFRLRDKVLGLIGFGQIARATALRAQAFGLKVIFYDPYVKNNVNDLNVTQVSSLGEIAQQSDIVSLHTPLTDETKDMIDEKFFKQAKKGVFIINTARGGLIDIAALDKAMKDETVLACGLDALPIEPSDDSQKLIVAYEKGEDWLKGRLIVTPHVSYYSHEALKELRTKACKEIKRVLDGERPINCVNNFYDN